MPGGYALTSCVNAPCWESNVSYSNLRLKRHHLCLIVRLTRKRVIKNMEAQKAPVPGGPNGLIG